MDKGYKIAVRLITGQIFSYTVDKYWIEEGTILCFIDKKTNKIAMFDSRNCQIEPLEEVRK